MKKTTYKENENLILGMPALRAGESPIDCYHGDFHHVDSLFLYQVAPVLQRVKPATLISIKSKHLDAWKSRKVSMCKASRLYMKELRSKGSSSLYLIFDPMALKEVLDKPQAEEILSPYGYKAKSNVYEAVNYLKERLKEESFPHEIGLFLGYPLSDVKAFIENEGKNSLSCRYWKVYTDIKESQKIWEKIDRANKHARQILHSKLPIQLAAEMLKVS